MSRIGKLPITVPAGVDVTIGTSFFAHNLVVDSGATVSFGAAPFTYGPGALTPGVDTTLWTTKSLATAQTCNFTSRTTANSPITTSCTISNLDSLANNDDVILLIARTGAAGGDSLTVDAILTTAVLSWS